MSPGARMEYLNAVYQRYEKASKDGMPADEPPVCLTRPKNC